MTGPVPPTGPAPAPAPGQSTAPVPVEAGVESLPPRLSDVQRPVAVGGTVVDSRPSPDGGAVSRIRTAAGDVVVRTETPLPPGPVTVQLPPGRPPAQATVQVPPPPAAGLPAPAPGGVAVPAGTLPPATTVALATAGTGTAATPSVAVPLTGAVVPPPALAILLPGMPVRAQLLQTLPGGAQGLPGLPPLPGQAAIPGTAAGLPGALPTPTAPGLAAPPGAASPGTGMPVAGTALPGMPGAVAGPLAGPGSPALPGAPALPGVPSLPGVAGGSGIAGTAAAPTGATPTPGGGGIAAPGGEPSILGPAGIGTMRVLSIGDAPGRAPSGAGAVTVATVTGAQVGGQPVVATDRGLMVLQAHPGLPAGTRLTLEAVPPPAASSLPRLAPLDPMGSRDWPALQHVLDTLNQTDPQAARAITGALLPQVNARLAGNMALFMGVVRAGADPRAWIGDRAARALEAAGRGELIDRLADDLRGLQRQAEGAGSEWRTYPVPLMAGGGMDRVVVRVRRREDDGEGEGDGKDRRGGGTRFLVDVNLSRLGPMQLDGLVRPKRLDLIVRSRDALPETLRGELRQIYAGALADLRLAGDLGFQAGRTAAWVPLPQPTSGGRGVVA